MLTRPEDLPDRLVIDALRAGWGIDAEVEYRPVGFGSHHWAATAGADRWFVTVDFGPTGLLDAALSVARELVDTGMGGVVASTPQGDGELLHHAWTSDRAFAVSVFPHVDAPRLDETGGTDRTAVLELLADLHSRTDAVRELAPSDILAVPGRAELVGRLRDLTEPWASGPYAESVRDVLLPRLDVVRVALDRFDALAREAGTTAWVITHGEPHDRNLLATADGPALIDWDTARIGPAARDLWHVGDGSLAPRYTELTGREVPESELALYRLRWDLAEVAEYVAEFAAPHVASADSDEAFKSLGEALDGLDYDA